MQVAGELREIQPICVLDFYVHESCQRQGIGKELFNVSERGGRWQRMPHAHVHDAVMGTTP